MSNSWYPWSQKAFFLWHHVDQVYLCVPILILRFLHVKTNRNAKHCLGEGVCAMRIALASDCMHCKSCFLKSIVTCCSRRCCAGGNSSLLSMALSTRCCLASICGFACPMHSKYTLLRFQSWLCSIPSSANVMESYQRNHVLKTTKNSTSNMGRKLTLNNNGCCLFSLTKC